MTYYEKSVPSIGNFNIEFNPSDRPVCRVFNDFFIKKKPSLKEFVQQHIFNISRFVLTTITFTYPCWMVDISRQGHIMKQCFNKGVV
ncbi:hypothetical protein CHH48_01450 [Terribacillus saccharophilus]|uniref:Uncharacterized protein n=1 Tax=Terribacillus saccharophilus TaxID=361277 RepID=A0ABX4H2T5_9BACI|nr:hypothetical protein CHH56_00755 [Terribacillus saccharophilus]PAD97395.1 hypothetical protein CHH50_01460 [Terribacillus saccharophilus]PAE01443.1 hypothetical protein CHH48_01450 [Terribacillus saccharophilus]